MLYFPLFGLKRSLFTHIFFRGFTRASQVSGFWILALGFKVSALGGGGGFRLFRVLDYTP